MQPSRRSSLQQLSHYDGAALLAFSAFFMASARFAAAPPAAHRMKGEVATFFELLELELPADDLATPGFILMIWGCAMGFMIWMSG
jgi:hypothetical protein